LEREGRLGKLLLCRQPEQLVDDTVLGEGIPLGESLDLAFAEHIHGFIALDGSLRGVECPKLQPRNDEAFHKPVILFNTFADYEKLNTG
jgi:hypothetical protein